MCRVLVQGTGYSVQRTGYSAGPCALCRVQGTRCWGGIIAEHYPWKLEDPCRLNSWEDLHCYKLYISGPNKFYIARAPDKADLSPYSQSAALITGSERADERWEYLSSGYRYLHCRAFHHILHKLFQWLACTLITRNYLRQFISIFCALKWYYFPGMTAFADSKSFRINFV